MLKNNKQSVKYIDDLIAANNPIGLITALKNEGIDIPSGTTEIILSQLMDRIFNNDKAMWVRIIKATPFNPNVNNWTTQSNVVSNLRETIGADATSKIDLSGIFTQIGDFFGGSSTTGGGSSSSSSSVSPALAATVLIIISAIIAIIIWKK